jgi:hypothetical protein
MKLISWWGCGKIDQPLISGDKIVECWNCWGRSVWVEKLGRCDIIAETTIKPNAVMLTIKQRLLEAIDRAPIEELENTLAFLENRLTLQSSATHNSTQAVSILNQLAQINACATIEDPIAWQKAIRSDRPLPGRDD